jgi:hypothetical protein
VQGYSLSHEVKGEKVYKFVFHVLDKIQSRMTARYSTVTRQGATRQGKAQQGKARHNNIKTRRKE